MKVGEVINYLKSLVSDFLVYLLERVFGIYSFHRIVSNTRLTRGDRFRLVEQLLDQSKSEKLREFDWDSEDDSKEAEKILSVDDFSDEQEHKDMVRRLTLSFGQIRGHKKLREAVEQRRAIAYDPTNQEHEKKLLKLWKLLKPGEELDARKTLQWQLIGFQGDDPATDFRGMGILGLENLVFYAQYDAENCKRLLKIADNEVYGFPFCIAGITFTALCKQLLFENYLKNHFANTLKTAATMDNFNQVYCRIFNLFGDYWETVKPENVMFFNEVKNTFVESLKKYLEKSKADLFQADLVSLHLPK